MAVHTTTGAGGSVDMSAQVATEYYKGFLKRSKMKQVHASGAQKGTKDQNTGSSMVLNRLTPLAVSTTPLTQGSNPSESSFSTATVTVSLAEYGNTVKLSRFLTRTSIDKGNKEKIDTLGQNMGETMDTIVRDAMYSGATARLANGKSALSDVAASDVFDYDEVKKAVTYLELQNAIKYPDGMFMGKVGPLTKADLMASSAWLAAHTYKDTRELYKNELGELGGVRWELGTNQKSESGGATTVYSNFVHGAEAYGAYDLAGDVPDLFIVLDTNIDSNNPAGRFGLASWAGSTAAKVLVASWLVNVKTGATAL